MYYFESFPPHVSVAERKLLADAARARYAAQGQRLSPVAVTGNIIARSFWGQSWCRNLESYSDFENRLPRGRSYLRSGAVIDLKIDGVNISALVQGTSLYEVRIVIKAVAAARWQQIVRRCVGGLGSLVELLSGRISREVMTVVTERGQGLFPTPAEIKMSCSCPDRARLCKHIAATLYGAGARFDTAPELLFTLRNVDPSDLIVQVGAELPRVATATEDMLQVETEELGALFGIELGEVEVPSATAPVPVQKSAAPEPKKADEEKVMALRKLLERLERASAHSKKRKK